MSLLRLLPPAHETKIIGHVPFLHLAVVMNVINRPDLKLVGTAIVVGIQKSSFCYCYLVLVTLDPSQNARADV